VIRKLAECYQNMGDEGRFRAFTRLALEVDGRRLKKKPHSAAVHRSLTRTYQLLGDTANADKHLAEALRYALRRASRSPDDAAAAYSLGRTYEMLGRYDAALEQHERAYRLKPTSRKYRKAYYRVLRVVQ